MRSEVGRIERLERLAAARQREQEARLRVARKREADLQRAAVRARDAAGERLARSRAEDVTADLGAWVAERGALLRARDDARESARRLEGAAGESERCRLHYLQAWRETEALRRLSLRRALARRQALAATEGRAWEDLAAVRVARADRGETR